VLSGDEELEWILPELWASRWLVALVTAAFLAGGTAYAFLGVKWYRAEVLLSPQRDNGRGRLLSQFGGLASLAGVDLVGGKDVEPVAVLRSRSFARQFIVEEGLMPVLLADSWDAQLRSWKGPQDRWPDERDAVKVFDEEVRHVIEDKKTGLVTLAIEWTDPVAAARWANSLAQRLNAQMRRQAIEEAETNVRFLRSEIAATPVSPLQQSASRLLELELEKLMLARGKTEFAVRVVDPATVPKKPSRPQKTVVIPVSLLLGLLVSLAIVWMRRVLRVASSR
jgi:uncharacterized protein involved in exopolysaccharide biosynthesis